MDDYEDFLKQLKASKHLDTFLKEVEDTVLANIGNTEHHEQDLREHLYATLTGVKTVGVYLSFRRFK